jgi:sialic acid synthase SpsE
MTEHARFEIAGRLVAAGEPLYVVAEIGLNHDGSVDRAFELVDAAAAAGADAVKLQSLRGRTLVAPVRARLAHVADSSLRELFARYELDEAAHRAVAARARSHGLAFLSTPFDEDAVDMLDRLDCDALKIASGDLTHHRLIARAAATGRPLVISTGLSRLDEVTEAVACARAAGASAIALLHCVSAYPVPDDQQNLGAIRTLAETFRVPVGLSDHSRQARDIAVAVALGAAIYERHVKPAPDAAVLDADVSSDPAALAVLVRDARRTRPVLGSGERVPMPAEAPNHEGSRRALYARRSLAPGDVVCAEDVVALRPAAGLDARRFDALVGTTLRRAVEADAPFLDSDVSDRGKGDARGAA